MQFMSVVRKCVSYQGKNQLVSVASFIFLKVLTSGPNSVAALGLAVPALGFPRHGSTSIFLQMRGVNIMYLKTEKLENVVHFISFL